MMLVKVIAAAALTGYALAGTAAQMRSLKSVDEAVRLAESVPVNGVDGAVSNVAQRMKAAGVSITGGTKTTYSSRAELDGPTDKVGDIRFTIHGTEPSAAFKRATCDMWGDASFFQRAGQFYPESRAANWLMTGDCSTKFAKPHR